MKHTLLPLFWVHGLLSTGFIMPLFSLDLNSRFFLLDFDVDLTWFCLE